LLRECSRRTEKKAGGPHGEQCDSFHAELLCKNAEWRCGTAARR
jgi:hypothetical protein